MEFVGEYVVGREFYILYKFVVRESVESIKFRIVYDVLVRAYDSVFLFNDCFYAGSFL